MSRAAVFAKDVSKDGFDLVFMHSGPERAKRRHVALARNVYSAAQQLEVVACLDESHLVQQLSRINDRCRADAVTLALSLKVAHQADKPLVKRRVAAETIINSVGLFDQLW